MADRLNRSMIALPLEARSAAPKPFVGYNPYGAFALIDIEIAAIDAGPTLTVTVEGIDPASGKPSAILASAALNSVGHTQLKIGPGLPVSANASVNDFLPVDYRIRMTHGGSAGSITYS